MQVPLHDPGTLAIQDRVRCCFSEWLQQHLSVSTISQLLFSPSLLVWVLKQYGVFLYSNCGKLYELRHLLVLVQQKYPRLRVEIGPAWELVTRWEELHPVKHRDPLPEDLYRVMFSLACLWRWKRMAALMLLHGLGLMAARREDLFAAVRCF